MRHRPTFSTLWAINGPLDLTELRRQLADFSRAGLDGVVFHPRFYPGVPAYLSADYLDLVSRLVLDARDLGLDFWIYDEDGWPSGTVGGRMLDEHPELRQRWAELQPDTGQPALRRFTRDGRGWAIVERLGGGVDYLSADLAPRFIELCYTKYTEGIAPEALAHVAGFFSDEPEFGLGHAQHELAAGGAIPWTADLAERYAERHGASLLDDLPSLFTTDDRSPVARVQFWELVTDLFADRYLSVLDRWCRDRGLRFTAHMKGEEHPLFQLPTLGSLGSISRAIGTPGIDALGRLPVNDFYPRQVSSAARQFGDGRAMAEAFGGAGWGAAPADLERYLRWLGGHGITDFVLHLSQYRLDTAAIEDWPPSHPRHVSWAELYREVLDAVRAELVATARPEADVLVVVPQRALAEHFEPWEFVATNVHDAHDFPDTAAGRINAEFLDLVRRLHAAGVAYEFADERTVERDARLVDGTLELGRGRYRRVLVAAGARLDPAAAARLAPVVAEASDGSLALTPSLDASPDAALPDVAFREAPTSQSVALGWTLVRRPVNELVVTPVRESGGWVARVRCDDADGTAELRFADEPIAATWDDAPLAVRAAGDIGYVASVQLRAGRESEVRIPIREPLPPGSSPRIWLAGDFVVRSGTPPEPRSGVAEPDPSLAILHEPFRLAAPRSGPMTDLTASGYPFLFEPVDAVAELELPPGAEALALAGGLADAARVQVGDGPAEWCWTSGLWTVSLGTGPDARGRTTELRIRLVPSSFNRYGPHHHYLGDPAVVSPAQMRGERNYADADDAPDATHVAHWWVRRLALPTMAEIRVSGPARPDEESALVDNQMTRS